MANIIKIVGVGPGSPDYLTVAGATALQEAELLVGARRLLEVFARPDQQSYPLGSDLEAAAEHIRSSYQEQRVVVLVSGDTGLYSLADYLAKRLPQEQLEFIPGISSVQLMFARLKRPWQDAVVLSCHGRTDHRLMEVVKAGLLTAVLTDNQNTPQALAKKLLNEACQDLPVAVGCNLSLEDEIIFKGTLTSLLDSKEKFVNCVVIFGV